LRENWHEVERLVEQLLRERTITFVQPKPIARAATPAPKPAVPVRQVRTGTMPLLVRSAPMSTSFDAASNSIDVVWTTGEPVTRTDAHGTRYVEILETGERNVDLSRLNAGAPFLDNHRSGSLDAVSGRVMSARMEGGKGYANILLSKRKEVAG